MDANNWRGYPAHQKRVGGANQLAPPTLASLILTHKSAVSIGRDKVEE